MDDNASDSDRSAAFSSAEEGFGTHEDAPSWGDAPDLSQQMDMTSLARDVVRRWVQENQKAVMLGAFGAGVFVGVLLRE